jgi:antitoxin HicB
MRVHCASAGAFQHHKVGATVAGETRPARSSQMQALPGCLSQGATRKEAIANIKDALEGYLASLKKHNESVPPPIEEETVEVNA